MQSIGIWQASRHDTIGGFGAVLGRQAPQQSPTPSA
jgi:hypothetical protein